MQHSCKESWPKMSDKEGLVSVSHQSILQRCVSVDMVLGKYLEGGISLWEVLGFISVSGGDLELKPKFYLYHTYSQGSEFPFFLYLHTHRSLRTHGPHPPGQAGCLSFLQSSCVGLAVQSEVPGPAAAPAALGGSLEMRNLCSTPDLKSESTFQPDFPGISCPLKLEKSYMVLDWPCQWNQITCHPPLILVELRLISKVFSFVCNFEKITSHFCTLLLFLICLF